MDAITTDSTTQPGQRWLRSLPVAVATLVLAIVVIFSLRGDPLSADASSVPVPLADAQVESPVETIDWPDLRAEVKSEDPFAGLSLDQMIAVSEIEAADAVPSGSTKPHHLKALERGIKAEALLAEDGVDGRAILARKDALSSEKKTAIAAGNQTWDGKSIRIEGHLLPLTAGALRVTEFLLVPFVGACIHAPTPAPNQIIRVKLENSQLALGMYRKVTVSGAIEAKSTRCELFLVDGSKNIETAFTMSSGRIEATAAEQTPPRHPIPHHLSLR